MKTSLSCRVLSMVFFSFFVGVSAYAFDLGKSKKKREKQEMKCCNKAMEKECAKEMKEASKKECKTSCEKKAR
ncbi:hypothetical protein [Emticicia sp. BO119]|uniref:hypothetical protein n=1 Tax=Emticicia sp. BO119 TaxID=2757768 RepID=UPI0015F0B6AF|nr:hypothetical protein [Emticicia sp. BO119]MBA4849536.1 hypothetical protein [Emticicia sp. BO119]